MPRARSLQLAAAAVLASLAVLGGVLQLVTPPPTYASSLLPALSAQGRRLFSAAEVDPAKVLNFAPYHDESKWPLAVFVAVVVAHCGC